MLKTKLPSVYDNIILSSKTTRNYENYEQGIAVEAITYTVENNNNIKGYLVIVDGDYSYTAVGNDKFDYINLIDDSKLTFERINDNNGYNGVDFGQNELKGASLTNQDTPCSSTRAACITGCTVVAVLMAASDGPLPAMDAVAVATWGICAKQCYAAEDVCEKAYDCNCPSS